MHNVRVRFAPSPTGLLHIGGLRTALFNWLFARKHRGTFILRIEDTDRERFVEGAVENIVEALRWYGLDFDEGPFYQSARLDLYKKNILQLQERGAVYPCFCTAGRLQEVRRVQQLNKQVTKYDGLCRNLSIDEVTKRMKEKQTYVMRLKVPQQGSTFFHDEIYGKIKIENTNIDDQVLLKTDGYPTYHFANVVDDHEMRVSHIIRAEEWLPSTPKHVLLYQAFEWQLPVFAHLPMVLGTDRSKLSKRHGAMAALEYRELGYLPEAVLNFIALLGWNPKTEREIFSLPELVNEFDLTKVNKASAVFNFEKLNWLNGQYIKKLPLEKLASLVQPNLPKNLPQEKILSFIALVHDRLDRLSELRALLPFMYADTLSYDANLLIPKKAKSDEVLSTLEKTSDFIKKFGDGEFTLLKLKPQFEKFIGDSKLSNQMVLWPLRVALTGLAKSPGVFEVMEVLGKAKTIQRVQEAIDLLKKI